MPTYRDEAVVLRTHKLGEADRIVTMLSRRHGKIRAVAKGVRRTGSRFGARLEPFMVIDGQFYIGRTLDIVQQAESAGSYGADIVDDYPRYTAANAMVEAADRLTEHEAGLQHYLLLVGALRSLSRAEHAPGMTLDSYLLRALSIAGWAPSLRRLRRHRRVRPAHARSCRSSAGWWRMPWRRPARCGSTPRRCRCSAPCSSGDWDAADDSDERTRDQASGVIAAYTQFHLERGLRSLELQDRVS